MNFKVPTFFVTIKGSSKTIFWQHIEIFKGCSASLLSIIHCKVDDRLSMKSLSSGRRLIKWVLVI